MFFGTSNLEVFGFHLCCLTISNTKKEPDLKSIFYLPSMWTLEDEYHCSTVLKKCGEMEQKLNSIFSLPLTIRIFSLHFSGGMNNISLLSTMCLWFAKQFLLCFKIFLSLFVLFRKQIKEVKQEQRYRISRQSFLNTYVNSM